MKLELTEEQQALVRKELDNLTAKLKKEDWDTDPWGLIYLRDDIEDLEEILKTNTIEI